jgi:hypothetical protein
VCFFFDLLSKFFERFKRLNDYKPTEDEKEAGLERLSYLSSFGTPLSLARRTNMTPEQILMRPAEEVYMILLVDFEQAEYEKNLRKVQADNEAIQNALRQK